MKIGAGNLAFVRDGRLAISISYFVERLGKAMQLVDRYGLRGADRSALVTVLYTAHSQAAAR